MKEQEWDRSNDLGTDVLFEELEDLVAAVDVYGDGGVHGVGPTFEAEVAEGDFEFVESFGEHFRLGDRYDFVD